LATPWDFGIDFHHSLELAPGNYVALFVSGNFSERYGIGRSAPRVTYGDAYFDTKENIVMADLPISEFFYKKVFFTVTNKDIRQTVVLDRITAGLEVELQDVLPPNVYVNITVHDATTYSFKTDTRGGGYRKMYYRNPYTLISNVLNAGPTKVTITAVDERNNVLATKDVIATFVPNRKTKLIGKLFSPVSFTVHANLEWDAPGPTVQF
jgi:hypothetical protein